MQELEKILEEIEQRVDYYREHATLTYADILCAGLREAEGIIRKHMNDGWIPSNKHLPKAPEMEDEYPEFNVMIEGAKTPTTLQYTHEGIWVDDYGNVYNVIAWQPLPEPYIPRNQNKPEERYPEWRAKFLNKFDRRL